MIILDSHIWFWWVNLEHNRMPSPMLAEIENESHVGVSPVSCFELALAQHRGRLALSVPARQWFSLALAGSNLELLPMTPEISARAVELTEIHRDPFDRIIIATALELNARLASIDKTFAGYPELADRLIGIS
jgi:PIN domain nuclease of toxin-antitoxin system